MTHLLRLAALAACLFALAACPSGPPPEGEDSSSTPKADTGGTAAEDAAAVPLDAAEEAPDADEWIDPPDAALRKDAGRKDASAPFNPDGGTTPPEDGGATTPADGGTVLPGDAGACQPLVCKLLCPFGLRQDANGCDVCACRECSSAKDCKPTASCASPTCSAGGDCGCDCSTYKPAAYTCPDGKSVPMCACGTEGIDCLSHPEWQCAGICTPGETASYACPDRSRMSWCTCNGPKCVPECRNVGTRSEGWYDSCTGVLIGFTLCDGCTPVCSAIGSRSEGWVSSCDGAAIGAFAACGPSMACSADPAAKCPVGVACQAGATAAYPCPDGSEVPQCTCAPPDAACPPTCQNVGMKTEGWYNSCTGVQLRLETCGKATAKCGSIGTKSEGWYRSDTGALIGYAQCGTPAWACDAEPWTRCAAGRACHGAGETFSTRGGLGECCAALDDVSLQILGTGGSCSSPFLPMHLCTDCGDGLCEPPENACDCPEDCWNPALRALGELCSSSVECEVGLVCLEHSALSGVGVCSKTCDPSANACGRGFACLAVPEHAAAGYCLPGCTSSATCAAPTTCGGQFGTVPVSSAGCFTWGECDPMSDDWCLPTEQCRVGASGAPVCGPVGKLAEGDACDPAKDACGAGLACGPARVCVPACMDDALCTAKKYTYCLKRPYTATYGVCLKL